MSHKCRISLEKETRVKFAQVLLTRRLSLYCIVFVLALKAVGLSDSQYNDELNWQLYG